MHVLHVIEATIGGTRRHVVDACGGLARRGVRTTLVAACLREPAFRGDLERLARAGVEVRELPMRRAIRPATDFAHVAQLAAWLRELQPDVVHTHSSKAGVLGRLASLSTGVGARVHTPHTFAFLFGAMFGRASRRVFREIEAALAGSTQRFVAVSDDEGATFARTGFIAPARIRVVPNGVDPRPWSAAEPLDLAPLGVPRGAPVAAVIGLLNLAKGQDLALRALAEPGLESLHLLVAGHGELRPELERLARELGLAGRVHLLGWRDDAARIARAADFVVVPSRWEGMPYVVLEAMAATRPVVATEVDGARCVVAGAHCGLLAEVGDVGSLAAQMRAMLALGADARRAMGERGRAALGERYTLEGMVDGLVATYAELA